MSDEHQEDDGNSVKISVGLGGGDPFDSPMHRVGMEIDAPPVQFMTSGQKIAIAVIAILVVLYGAYQLYQALVPGE